MEYKDFLELRDITTPCKNCNGIGKTTYGSTATWHGGIGGCAMRRDICNVCWGSGDALHHGIDLRKYEFLQRFYDKNKERLYIK